MKALSRLYAGSFKALLRHDTLAVVVKALSTSSYGLACPALAVSSEHEP
jgi:hypothetical protein